MKYINCEEIADSILGEAMHYKYDKKFAIVSVGDDAASEAYMKGKLKDCKRVNVEAIHCKINPNEEFAREKLKCLLHNLSHNDDFGAIILQLPLPKGWDAQYYQNLIPAEKDVDGLSSFPVFHPCTPEGVCLILREIFGCTTESLRGKDVLIIGRSALVGRPLFDMLIDLDCTVTVAHSKTKNLEEKLGNYDIIVSAAGSPKLVDLKKCTKAQVVIDVGINRIGGKLHGDCYNFSENELPNLLVTPVPKGVGLLTRAMLIKHVSTACRE